jgi:hypothetical protein
LGNFDLAVDEAKCSRILTHLLVNQNCTSNLNPRMVINDGVYDFVALQVTARCPAGSTLSGGNCLPSYDNTKPSAQVDSNNKFQPDPTNVPPGGRWMKIGDGSWQYSDTNGNWGSVSADGTKLTMNGDDVNGNPKSVLVTTYPDGSKNISTAASVPVTDTQGNPSFISSVVTTSVAPSGKVVASTVQSDPNLNPSNTSLAPGAGGNGQTVAQQSSTMPSGSPSGSTTGTGSCASGDCATETTQQANKALLQQIHSDLTSTGTASGDPTPYSGSDIQKALNDAFGPLDDLRGWRIPPHQSVCPSGTFVFPYTGIEMTFDPGCDFASQNISLISFSFVIFWNLAAMFIVLRA